MASHVKTSYSRPIASLLVTGRGGGRFCQTLDLFQGLKTVVPSGCLGETSTVKIIMTDDVTFVVRAQIYMVSLLILLILFHRCMIQDVSSRTVSGKVPGRGVVRLLRPPPPLGNGPVFLDLYYPQQWLRGIQLTFSSCIIVCCKRWCSLCIAASRSLSRVTSACNVWCRPVTTHTQLYYLVWCTNFLYKNVRGSHPRSP